MDTTYTNYSLFQGELLLQNFEADGDISNLALDGRCYTENNDNVFDLADGVEITRVDDDEGNPTWFDLLVPSSKTNVLKSGNVYWIAIRAIDGIGNERVLFRATINVINSPHHAN